MERYIGAAIMNGSVSVLRVLAGSEDEARDLFQAWIKDHGQLSEWRLEHESALDEIERVPQVKLWREVDRT